MKRTLTSYLPVLLLLAGLLAIWEIYARSGLISKRILPAPSNVFTSLYDVRDVLLGHTLQTITETVLGLLLAIIIGITIAVSIFWSGRIRKAVYPLLVISQTIPLIALAPLFIIWFGFGLLPKVLIVMLFCFFPIAVAASDGLINTPRHYSDYLKSLGASRWQTLVHVHAPHSLDSFFSGLNISTTYAVTGAIIGEYVGAYKGLGIYMQTVAHSHAINLVFAAIFVVVALTMLLLLIVLWLQKVMMPWKENHEKNI